MDAETPIARERQTTGGTVEPKDRAPVAIATFQTPDPAAGPRFELRDPTTELIYHARSFDDMVAKADRMQASRFTAIDKDGKRSVVQKVDGAWQRPPWLDREPEPGRDDAPSADKAPAPPIPEATIARIDAEAERKALVERLEAALTERYIIRRATITLNDRPAVGQTEYRFRGDTSRVAFTESTFKLATDTNSPSVARSMVDLTEVRHWKALRVSGHEDFKRMVWLEASARGVKTIGYEPTPADMELLRKTREDRQVNRIEPVAGTVELTGVANANGRGGNGRGGWRDSGRDSGSRKAVLAAIEAVLVAQGVPEKRREAIMVAAADNLARRAAAGDVHRVKVYDKDATVQRPHQRPDIRPFDRTQDRTRPDQQRAPEHTPSRAPARAAPTR